MHVFLPFKRPNKILFSGFLPRKRKLSGAFLLKAAFEQCRDKIAKNIKK